MRVSLLVSLGVTPLACGGTAISTSDGGAGSPAQAGAGAQAGGSYAGGSYGGGGGYAEGPYGGGGYAGGTGVPGGAGGDKAPNCESPSFDPVTRLTKCANGFAHRPKAIACAYTPINIGSAGAAGAATDSSPAGSGGTPSCITNADCTALPFGYCQNEAPFPSQCEAGCQQDSDCSAAQLCECDGSSPAGKCVTANCQVDTDCGASSFCAPVAQPCSDDTFVCTSNKDECLTDADCAVANAFSYCASFASDHRACTTNASCGRPFLVSDCARLAETSGRADWLNAQVRPSVDGLSPLQRAELSAHWARLGQMEHASIAAFARFNLQLLSLGAPGELVEACNRALVDETAHTRLCFALASEYGGATLGPARLNIDHCFEDNSLEAIMKLVLREGCLGETVAALEAVEAAALATDPAVKSALSRIAQDERAHAELAFKFLAWVLTLASPEARTELEQEARGALDDFEAAALARPSEQRRESLASNGIVGAEALRAIHLGAVREVVEPLLSAILRQSANASHSALTQA